MSHAFRRNSSQEMLHFAEISHVSRVRPRWPTVGPRGVPKDGQRGGQDRTKTPPWASWGVGCEPRGGPGSDGRYLRSEPRGRGLPHYAKAREDRARTDLCPLRAAVRDDGAGDGLMLGGVEMPKTKAWSHHWLRLNCTSRPKRPNRRWQDTRDLSGNPF